MNVTALPKHTFEWLLCRLSRIGDMRDMRPGIVVQQQNSVLPISSFLFVSNIEFRVDRLFCSALVPFRVGSVQAIRNG